MDRSGAEPFGYMLLAQKYPSVQALLYYNTVEQYKMNATAYGLDMWAGETFNFGGNLDGTLFWPGRVGIQGLTSEQPIVSVRMKLLREAQNLADTLSMLDPDWVQTRADAIMTNPRTWTRDVSVFDTLQQDAIALLGATLTLSTSGTGIDQTYTIECTDQFRLVWDAGDNWGLCEWYDLVNDPTAANNLAGPGLPSGVTPDATIAEPGLFQQVFYQTDPDDCKTFTRSAKNYFPSTPRSFEVIENTPTRMQVASTCHPMVTAQGVLTDITVRVEYVITPDGQIKVTARTTATSGTTIGEWRNAVLGLQNPGGTGTTPPDVTGGWVRATSVQNPYSDTGTSPSYLFSYWDQTTGSNISYSKASVLLVPKSTNPTEGLPFNHSWNDWMRWGYRYPSGITISAGQTVTQRYLIQLGTEDSSILPDIKTSTVADPIAAAYQAESDSAATHTSQNFRRIGFFLN
jgi:hypothetical protein